MRGSRGGGGVKPSTKALLLGLAVLLALAAAWAVEIAQAQSDDEQAGRIVARRLDDGRTEFGWQPSGGAHVLPRARYFPAEVGHQRWLNSSPVEVGGVEVGRINARRLDDGRIEFAFTPTDGERIEPPARYFPVDAQVGRWLRSTEIAISTQPTIGQTTPPADSDDPPASSDDPATGFVAVSAGQFQNCAIRDTGAITCWGNVAGPYPQEQGSYTAVATGYEHGCAIRSDGAIECWGSNGSGQAAAPEGSFSAMSAGRSHTCALSASGAIECWGSNEDVFNDYTGQADPPAGSFSAVSAGDAHTCAIRAASGAIECWGDNRSGQADAPEGSFSAVSAGDGYTCAIRAASGAIECWGSNTYGQADAPEGSFSAVAGGGFHTCAIRASGAISCWGWNNSWEWNEETGGSEEVYGGQADAPEGGFSAVVAGSLHTCAIRTDGAIECWGVNGWGQATAPAP